jgi:putative FmdB family regulatory protein
MPTYNYKCNECNTKYEIFHKVKENPDDVICPSCNSKSSKKLITAANIGVTSNHSSNSAPLQCGMDAPCPGCHLN